MIQSIADKYKKHVAYPMLLLFYLQTIILPLHAATNYNVPLLNKYYKSGSKNSTTNTKGKLIDISKTRVVSTKKKGINSTNAPTFIILAMRLG